MSENVLKAACVGLERAVSDLLQECPVGESRADFEVTQDGVRVMAIALVTVRIEDLALQLVDDFATTKPNTPVEIDVLANDKDPLNRPLRIVKVTPSDLGGKVEIINDGKKIRYTPPPGAAGVEDQFKYEVEPVVG